MPQAVTLAPPEARRMAMARPIPVVPVTIATLFSNSFTEDRSLVSQLRSRSRGNSPPILDLGAKRFEECTAPGGNLETQDPLRTTMARESSVLKFRVSVSQTLHYATQFSEPLQATDIGITGIGFFVDVVGQ